MTFDKPDARSMLAGEAVTFAHHPTNRSVPNLLRTSCWRFGCSCGSAHARSSPRAPAWPCRSAGSARALGTQVVYIESFARVDHPSLTGRLVHPVANRFFVQWPGMVRHFPKAEYRGGLF